MFSDNFFYYFMALALTSSVVAGCSRSFTSEEGSVIHETTNIAFSQQDFVFSAAKTGSVLKHTYKIKNTGTADLLILNVVSSCGCTVAEYTKKFIKPNHIGYVSILFSTHNKKGIYRKTVDVFTNTSPTRHTLSFTASLE